MQILTILAKHFFKNSFKYTGMKACGPFGLVLDPQARDPFLPEWPLDIFKTGKFNQIPIMFGTVGKEILFGAPGNVYFLIF